MTGKGQAGLEYLLIYSFVVIIAATVGGVLYYYGVFSPVELVGQNKMGFSRIYVDTWEVSERELIFLLYNNGEENVTVEEFYIKGKACSLEPFGLEGKKGADGWHSVNFTEEGCSGVDRHEAGESYGYDVSIQYRPSGQDRSFNSSGKLIGTVHAGAVYFSLKTPGLEISLVSPASDTDVARNEFFAVELNVTCSNADCGDIDVSLDPTGWANYSFERCRNVTLGNAGSSLADFPYYVSLARDSEMLPDYSDLRFYNASCGSGGAELDYEIGSRNSSHADVWLRIPSLPPEGFFASVYYKNVTSVEPGENAAGVWVADYISIYHLEHTSGAAADVMDNFNAEDGIDPDLNMDREGVVGRGDYFDGSDYLGNNPEWNVDRAHMYCVWVKFEKAHDGTILEDGGNTDGHGLGILPSGKLRYAEQYNKADNYLDSDGVYDDGQWHHLCGGHTGSIQLLYIDGSWEASEMRGDGMVGGNNARIGMGNGQNPVFGDKGDHYLNATIDEIRVSGIYRSPDWINQSYQAIANQNEFVLLGSEESKPVLEKGLVPEDSGSPFYTNRSNPYGIILNESQSLLVTFWVNATGVPGSTYRFFGYANLTGNSSVSNSTRSINVTVV